MLPIAEAVECVQRFMDIMSVPDLMLTCREAYQTISKEFHRRLVVTVARCRVALHDAYIRDPPDQNAATRSWGRMWRTLPPCTPPFRPGECVAKIPPPPLLPRIPPPKAPPSQLQMLQPPLRHGERVGKMPPAPLAAKWKAPPTSPGVV